MKTFKELFIERWRKNSKYRAEDEEMFTKDLNDTIFKELEAAAEEYKDQCVCGCNAPLVPDPAQLDIQLEHHLND